MTPKKVVPKGTDDIIELTDIVEPGVLPNENAGAGLTDATFEDELDSMLADAPELSAAAKDMGAAPETGASPAVAADDDFADLDSLLDDLGDDLPNAKPPAPKIPPPPGAPVATAAVPEETLLDVDDLLAEVGAGDMAAFASKASAAEAAAPAAEDDGLDVDEFLAAFETTDAAAQPASAQVIDAAELDADALLAELQDETPPPAEEDDLLAELKSVMGGDLTDTPVVEATAAEPALAPESEIIETESEIFSAEPEAEAAAAEPEIPVVEAERVPEPDLAEVDLTELAGESAQPEPAFDLNEVAAAADEIPSPADAPVDLMAELAPEMPADEDLMAMAAAADASADVVGVDAAIGSDEAVAPDAPESEPQAPDTAEGALADEDLQHLDALLDDILQPTAAPVAPAEEPPVETPPQSAPEIQAPVVEEIPPPAAPGPAPEPACAAVVDADDLLAGLLAEDGPLLGTVRDLVRQEMEARLVALEERLVENLDKAAAKAAAQVIREEIVALAQDMD